MGYTIGYTEQELSDEFEYEQLVKEAKIAWHASVSADGQDSPQAEWYKDQLDFSIKDLRHHRKRMETNEEHRAIRQINAQLKQEYEDTYGEYPPEWWYDE